MTTLGVHILADLYECDPTLLADVDVIRDVMLEAARRGGATIVTQCFHRFSPHGVSGVVVIAESHLAIHTWPEHSYAAIDLFTCGDRLGREECLSHLREALRSRRHETSTIERGHHRLTSSEDPSR